MQRGFALRECSQEGMTVRTPRPASLKQGADSAASALPPTLLAGTDGETKCHPFLRQTKVHCFSTTFHTIQHRRCSSALPCQAWQNPALGYAVPRGTGCQRTSESCASNGYANPSFHASRRGSMLWREMKVT